MTTLSRLRLARRRLNRKIDWMVEGVKRGYDGCTHSPDGTWIDCCYEHDADYYDRTITRLEADNKMARCMAKRGVAGFFLAPVYWTAVRVFGGNYWERVQNEARKHDSVDGPS